MSRSLGRAGRPEKLAFRGGCPEWPEGLAFRGGCPGRLAFSGGWLAVLKGWLFGFCGFWDIVESCIALDRQTCDRHRGAPRQQPSRKRTSVCCVEPWRAAIVVAIVVAIVDSLRGSSVIIGTIQRRSAWPLRKDHTHKSS